MMWTSFVAGIATISETVADRFNDAGGNAAIGDGVCGKGNDRCRASVSEAHCADRGGSAQCASLIGALQTANVVT